MHSPMFTLEVFPPKRNAPVGTIYDTLDGLEGLNPDFISVTYGHGTHSDRTATARIAHTISKEYGIPAVAHLTALYSDKAKIDEALDMFEEAGVSAVLALRLHRRRAAGRRVQPRQRPRVIHPLREAGLQGVWCLLPGRPLSG